MDLKFVAAYLDEAKQFKELVPIIPKVQEDKIYSLKSNDTTYFTFKLPEPKNTEHLAYFKIVISENELPHGLNSKTIKLD